MLVSLVNIEERSTEINLDREEEKRQRKIDTWGNRHLNENKLKRRKKQRDWKTTWSRKMCEKW